MERLNVFKKQKIKAVILLEAVISLAIFASIATLLLGQIQESRRREAELLTLSSSFADQPDSVSAFLYIVPQTP